MSKRENGIQSKTSEADSNNEALAPILTSEQPIPVKTYDLHSWEGRFEMFKDKLPDEEIKSQVKKFIDDLVDKHKLQRYQLAFLIDEEDSIGTFHTNKIYSSVKGANQKKDIFVVVHSSGGSIEPAYLLSRACKQLKKDKFVVAVPRHAKSAATLFAFGANEIHMGLMSELGPVDPQIGKYPALALKDAIHAISKFVDGCPKSSEMWSSYLVQKLNLIDIGYYERVTESAVQYSERLLEGKTFPTQQTAESLAKHFVHGYMNHGFVVDVDEAEHLLGPTTIKRGTPEMDFAEDVFDLYKDLSLFYEVVQNKYLWCVGGAHDMIDTRERKA